jgi:predicted ATPase
VGLLDDAERSLLETVAAFLDGWTVAAAAQVADPDEHRALELSETLARHSLVQVDRTALGPRSRMLETVRAFVTERLAARPDLTEIQRRHAAYYRALAERADRSLRSVENRGSLELLQAEAGYLAVAVEWYLGHDTAPLPNLFRVLLLFWEQRDHLSEARP